MAETREQTGERTQMPTPLRLAEARQRGFVPRSGDLVAAAVGLAAVAAAGLLGGGLLDALRRLTAAMLAEAGETGGWSGEVTAAGGAVAACAVGILLAVAAVAVAVNVAQFGLLASGEAVRMDFTRLSLGAGLGRMVSLRAAVRAGLGVAKVALVAGLATLAVRGAVSAVMAATGGSVRHVAERLGGSIWTAALWAAAALAAVAVVDLLYQRWQYRRDLMMTRREFLEDLRKMEPSPRVRRRARAAARRQGRPERSGGDGNS